VVLGVAEQAGTCFPGQGVIVLVLPGSLGQLGGHLHLPVGGGGIHEHDVNIQVQQVRDRAEDLGGDLLQ
jgi:hypothetical protein